MNPSILLKSLLPGLVPLIVFVAADAIFGETIGLVVGLAVGVVEFVYAFAKDRKADPFIAADTLLLALAGGLSLGLRNELFFKLKPAVIEFVLAVAMSMLLLLPPAWLKSYMSRQLRGVELPEAAMPAMKRGLSMMLGALVLHIALCLWAAFALSTAAWGFVTGGLLYILFGAVALIQFLSARRQGRVSARKAAKAGELLPQVDGEGNILGVAPAAEFHGGQAKLHPAVRLHIFDGKGSVYLRRMPAPANGMAGDFWDAAGGGHVRAGEELASAIDRELREGLGLTAMALEASQAKPQAVFRYRSDLPIGPGADLAFADGEAELIFVYAMKYDGPFAPGGGKDGEGKFWALNEIRSRLGSGIFAPGLEREIKLFENAASLSGGS